MDDQNSDNSNISMDHSDVKDCRNGDDYQHCDSYTEYDAITPEETANDHVEMDYSKLQLTDLPEEIVERILSFLSPYNDHDIAKLVCHQWHRIIKSLIKQSKRIFYHRLNCNKVGWMEVIQVQNQIKRNSGSSTTCFRSLSITERYSHSCAYLNGSMYVFGGCTNKNTTFNDLWRLDLTTRRWMRPVAMGSYPSPKACATMVVYKGKLVLFGGWSHPIPFPLHQSANYFSELHIYDPATNRWSLLLSIGPEPEALGGHSASVIQDLMVVFGGSPRPGVGSNKLWVYDFRKSDWYNMEPALAARPEPRYGQYQCTLDDTHILIMGGSSGSGRMFNDLYVLTLESENYWFWTKLNVKHPEFAPKQLWCHAVCKVENKLVVLSKSSKQRESLNVKPNIFYAEDPQNKQSNTKENKNEPATSTAESETYSSDSGKPSPLMEENSVEIVSVSNPEVEDQASNHSESHSVPLSNNRSLLALQQRLHRDYANLTDQHNHQHNSHLENNIPEGQIHRLQNRSNQCEGSNNHHPHQQQHSCNHHQFLHESNNQPHAGQLIRVGQSAARENLPMPSIRPNANCKRQKQLEALQRHEELLRTKSKAIAEARKKQSGENKSAANYHLEEEVPSTVVVKNCMDVHVLDISTAITTTEVEWKPESPLLPPGAPLETMCCSFVEGRAELILFGGILRKSNASLSDSPAINKLYILQS